MQTSLRTKLIMSSLLLVLMSGVVVTFVGSRLIGDRIVKQAQDKVRIDLNSARKIYRDRLDKINDVIRLTAVRFFIKDNLRVGNIEAMKSELQRIREQEQLDILTITDDRGGVIFRARNPERYGDSQINDELVHRALVNREIIASTEIISTDELKKEGNDLARLARIELIPTPRSKLRSAGEEDGGMMLRAAAPVVDYNGRVLGALYGGVLLNQNYEIVDKIKETVYQGEVYKGKDIGTATIFQGDLRISTNVEREDGSRAIGTRVSEEVYDQVLIKGLPWTERAFVVTHWYITAYEPIHNIAGEIIGILYVGILEDKYTDMKRQTIGIFVSITLAGVTAALIVFYFIANGIVKPIERLVVASERLAGGDLTQKVYVHSKDEIGKLGTAFNFMADALRDRDEELKQRVQQKLMESERLATIGQLAAGVAHEMNNPLGGILLYASLLLEKARDDDPAKGDLQRIVNETERCRKIIRGLLDFSRQTKLEMIVVDLNKVLENTLELVKHQAIFHNIEVFKKLHPSPLDVMADVGQIQQVFVNILLNAVESMDGVGSLTVSTDMRERGNFAEIQFVDTGSGITRENLSKIFDPFFTTKTRGKGTGLGLSIAYGIVRKHNGTIEVESEVGKGSVFRVLLPVISRQDK